MDRFQAHLPEPRWHFRLYVAAEAALLVFIVGTVLLLAAAAPVVP